jgi:hypothetical protein
MPERTPLIIEITLSPAEVEAVGYYCPDVEIDGETVSGVEQEVRRLVSVGIAHSVSSYAAIQAVEAVSAATELKQKYDAVPAEKKAEIDSILTTFGPVPNEEPLEP